MSSSADIASPTQTAFDHAPCALAVLTPDGNAVQVNHACRALLGWAADEDLSGRPLRVLMRLEGTPGESLLPAHLSMVQPGATVPPLELRVRHPSGEVQILQLSVSAVADAAGQVVQLQAWLLNVGERRVLEQRLATQVEFLRALTDRTPSRLTYFDSDLVCRFANRAQAERHGRTPQQMVGMHLTDLIPAANLPRVMARVTRALAGEAQTFEADGTAADGQPSYHEVHYVPDVQGGEVVGIFMELNDITERRRTEDIVLGANLELEERVQQRTAELHASEQRFRLMVDAVRDSCIYFVDAEGFIVEWSESAQRLHGFDRVQVLGRPLSMLLPTDTGVDLAIDPEQPDVLVHQAVDHGHADTQGWRLRADGSRFFAHVSLTALRNPAGELQGISVIERDMTAAKQLEDVMNDLNKELERRVEERTRQLVAANKDLDVFSHTISHDLRAPLRHIGSFAGLIREQLGEQGDPQLLQYESAISRSARRMAGMVEGLLEYARLGRIAVDYQAVPLMPLVQGVVAHLKAEHPLRDIAWDIESDLPVARGDPMLLAQLFAHLLENALKFTGRTPQARVEIGWTVSDQGVRTFHVRDNGVGFDLQKAANLFVMFQRQHHSMDYDGLGTGLALAQRIVERHGGRIWCETAVGEGCTFLFTLPFEVEEVGDSRFGSVDEL
jgi:PAS domain S-box-containing protein